MTNTNSVIKLVGTVISKAALSMALTTSNATCYFTSYQPVEPKGLAKFKK